MFIFLVHNATVLTKIINDVNHILNILDEKTKLASSPQSGEETVIDKTSAPPKQMVMSDRRNSSENHPKKKNHQRILETFFDVNGGVGSDEDDATDTGVGSGDISKDRNAERKEPADEGLNDLEDDMESEVTTLLAQLGIDFSGDSYKHSHPLKMGVTEPNIEGGITGRPQSENIIKDDYTTGDNGHSERETKELNSDYQNQTTSDADEDILDMITNILQDHLSSKTNRKDPNQEETFNHNKDNNNVSSKDTYFIPLTSDNDESVDKKSSPNSTGEGTPQTNVLENEFLNPTTDESNSDLMLSINNKSQTLMYKQVPEENSKANLSEVELKSPYGIGLENKFLDAAENSNNTIPAFKQSDHQTMNEGFDGKSHSIERAGRVEDLGITRKTNVIRQKSQEGNDAHSVVNFETTPTPSSQLLQTFPGAISYNVKLTNEESPPGKGAKGKPGNPTNMAANSSEQSETATDFNHSSAFSTENNKDLMLNERHAMTQRIFEVGQAALEAGKNMILAEKSHVAKEKIYDIVGTRNVTSVGRYLITIGEELLNRGKTLGSKKIGSSKVRLLRNKAKPSPEIRLKNFTSLPSFDKHGMTNEADSNNGINMVAESDTSYDSDNLECRTGAVHHNASLRGRVRAGLFIPTGYAKDPIECGKRCCDEAKCDMALVVNNECYIVECFHWTLCQVVPYQGSSEFTSAIVSIRRLHHLNNSEAILRHGSQNNSRPVHESKTKENSISQGSNDFQNYHPPRRHLENTTNGNKTKFPYIQSTRNQNQNSQLKRPKSRNVQRKELDCRSAVMNRTGNLKPGSWRLSGRTNSSNKCVDLCCSQNGCDLAFQIGEVCYSLACYKDNRGCNPLAIPVGLSYLRHKRREKLASKSVDNSEEKLGSDSGSHIRLHPENGDGSKFDAASEKMKKLTTEDDISKTNPILSKDQNKQTDFSNEKAGVDSKGNSNALENTSPESTPSWSNDFDIVRDNDHNGDVMDDTDDDDIGNGVHDYGTDAGDDDDYDNGNAIGSESLRTSELKNYQKYENKNNKHSNLVTLNDTEDHITSTNNQTSTFLTQPSSVIHETISPENGMSMTSHVENEISTTDSKMHGIPSTGNLENTTVKDGSKEAPYLSKHSLDVKANNDSSLVNHSVNGLHGSNDKKHTGIGYTISRNNRYDFDDHGVRSHSSMHSGSNSIGDAFPEGKDRGNQSHDDEVGINNTVKLDVGLAHPNKTSPSLTSAIKKNNSSHKGIPDVISKEQRVQNILKKLRKEGEASSKLSLQPPNLKDKDINDETYVIYDDADNGDGSGLSGTLKIVSRSNGSRSVNNNPQKDAVNLQRSPFAPYSISELQNTTSEKPVSEENSIKTTGVNNTSTDGNKSLDRYSTEGRNISHTVRTHKSKSKKNNTFADPKNNTLVYRNNTETSLRQRDASGDTIPKTGKLNISNHSDDQKEPLSKSSLRGKNYQGDKILKPKTDEESELQYGIDKQYPFENFPSKEESDEEKGGDQWPWDVIPLDGGFAELPPKNNALRENTGSGFTEISDNNNMEGDKLLNTGESHPVSSDSENSETINIATSALNGSEALSKSLDNPYTGISKELVSPTSHLNNSSHSPV